MAATTTTCPWHSLPNEMKLAVVENLSSNDARAFSKVDLRTYKICVSTTFKSVKLNSMGQLQNFLDNVPRTYCQHIQELDLSTQADECSQEITSYHPRAKTDAVISILIASPRLRKLALRIAGSLDKEIITPFAYLPELKDLTITNCSGEEHSPLSERLVVSIAATTRSLETLSLDKITRSKLHAPELEGVYPFVPLVTGDDDIPDHSSLGSELSLPSLLRIPNLKKLIIRDTHLGDHRWATTPVACRLEVLDLGSCYHETEDFNRVCTERIMAAVGPTIDEFSLTTSVSDTVFAKPSVTPLPRLRKLHITPFFPVDSVVDTMSNLAGSPIETLSMQCYEDDVVDVCSALEDFLSLRVERGPEFYDKLTRIDVSVTANDHSFYDAEEHEERIEATKRLQEFCCDLQLASVVGKAVSDPTLVHGPSPLGQFRASGTGLPDCDKKLSALANGRANLLL
ncbi:hypothetical protein D9615_006107 [Tricholomella constricta]|uniref:F-box domain-containing protein n=1 Tax=Tricholomella constricta TaxID=117010 RepID=A0A8H5HBI9_9AGAR|nr:hypothetical protein D9615_006107 [Tricholomella constricta]